MDTALALRQRIELMLAIPLHRLDHMAVVGEGIPSPLTRLIRP